MSKLRFTLFTSLALLGFSSCAIEGDEKPIRPVSPNSGIAHGSSSPSNGAGPLGALGGQGGFSR